MTFVMQMKSTIPHGNKGSRKLSLFPLEGKTKQNMKSVIEEMSLGREKEETKANEGCQARQGCRGCQTCS